MSVHALSQVVTMFVTLYSAVLYKNWKSADIAYLFTGTYNLAYPYLVLRVRWPSDHNVPKFKKYRPLYLTFAFSFRNKDIALCISMSRKYIKSVGLKKCEVIGFHL